MTFTDTEIKTIIKLYTKDNLNTREIGDKFSVSNTPIKRILKRFGVLRKGNSNGIKILLTTNQENKIKDLYLNHNKNHKDIGKELGLTPSFIDKYLANVSYRRNKSTAMSILKTGVKLSQKTKDNMSKAQQILANSGDRKQTGGFCKNFIVNGLNCQGTFEKYYIESLIKYDLVLPNKSESINTPFGVYYPDFSFPDKLIEIKSTYTYEILIGDRISGYTKKIETKQYEKIKWVDKNIKPIDILVIDKINNVITKKEIE